MYFFLSNLSLTDIGFTSTTVPKMIVDIQTHSRVISYVGCLTQMSLFAVFGGMEDMLLSTQCWVLVYLFPFFQPSFLLKSCPNRADPRNLTDVSEFLLLELSEDPELQPVLAGLFLSMYLVTVLGNLLIILAVSSDSHLHTPMYFFLSNLSLTDIGFTSTTVPKVIVDIQTHSRVISYVGCLTQMSLFAVFGGMEDMLLSVMAYDRFVAICYPLYYPVIMNPCFCGFLVLLSFFLSLLDSQLHNWIALQITCFKDAEIPNFFCDPSQLPHLACCDTFTNNIVMYFLAAIFGFLPILGILFSYYKIVSSILRVPSSGGRYKAFSTCGSHLSVVCLFYGTGVGGYLSSDVSSYPRKGAVASVMYTVVTPMLNPFIYSLRNRDIQSALRQLQARIL
ncbi:PREDICTED: olfactory receptor 7E24-like [Cercocebus atys]|uniref:olfactory receptor 7E24-like n=1 Tax=Cercocebus atys TaxID=9531 RepID=UPI0005F448C7|nr:PREDICTED: olfactory receptor 7E24-like [Cercocebus atys]